MITTRHRLLGSQRKASQCHASGGTPFAGCSAGSSLLGTWLRHQRFSVAHRAGARRRAAPQASTKHVQPSCRAFTAASATLAARQSDVNTPAFHAACEENEVVAATLSRRCHRSLLRATSLLCRALCRLGSLAAAVVALKKAVALCDIHSRGCGAHVKLGNARLKVAGVPLAQPLANISPRTCCVLALKNKGHGSWTGAQSVASCRSTTHVPLFWRGLLPPSSLLHARWKRQRTAHSI